MQNCSDWPLNKSLYNKYLVRSAFDWLKRMETILILRWRQSMMSTFTFSYYDRANYEVFWRALSLSLGCIKLTMKMEAEKLLFVFGTVLKRLNSFLLSVDDHTTVNECKVTSSCSPSSPSSSPSSPSSSPSLPSSSPSSTWALITTPMDARSHHNFGPQTLHNVWRWTKIAIDRHWPLYNCHQFPFGVMWLQQCNDN